jgi:hypothetical protein
VRFSDDGVAEITVDSGLAVYSYKIPAQSKWYKSLQDIGRISITSLASAMQT